jgi:hypothetical protein
MSRSQSGLTLASCWAGEADTQAEAPTFNTADNHRIAPSAGHDAY